MTASMRQLVACGSLLAAGTVLWGSLIELQGRRSIEVGFWFEEAAFDFAPIDGALTGAEREVIASIARSEIAAAFAGLRLVVTRRREARYKVAVVPYLRDERFRTDVGIAGGSRAIAGLGGTGAVSLHFLASGARACAPAYATRADVVEAIGRGIGRAAVHEFTHQFLPRASIHDSGDVATYEYASAARCEQYFGSMRWGIAWPLLAERFGR